MFSLCACCRRNNQKTDDGDVYGIVNPTVPVASEVVDGGSVQFRNGFAKKANDRHSLPANNGSTGAGHSRISAPGRALPQLPADLYSAIDKGRKSSLRFVDDSANPTYESIDPDADSFIDPLYSKVGDPISTRRDRKYDYPVFPGRRNEPGPSRQPDETYQSASQIYGGSEDPYRGRPHVVRFNPRPNIYRIPLSPPRVSVARYYRSIPSSSRVTGAEYGDEDSSSAYDPGYAKVQNLNQQRLDRLEKKEREVDQLYTKISRIPRDPDEDLGPRAMVELAQEQQELPVLSMFNPVAPAEVVATDSREPSYRYITVRENAERVRERLRQQGQLDPPTREHYYSTIGNEYDTIQGGGSTYGLSAQQSLTVHTEPALAPYAPPPPTSPIPHRLDYTDSQLVNERSPLPAYAMINKKRNSASGSVGASQGPGWNPLSLDTATSFAGLTRSFNGTSIGQSSPVGTSSTSIQGIKEFMQKPLLPYPSKETLLGRKVVEEREQIIEKRMSQSMGPSIDLGSSPHDRVHRVEINRVDGPSADTIISGRRYRGSTSHLNEGGDPPGSGRSSLPIPTNRAEMNRLSELAQQRKQRSLESDAVDSTRTVEKKRTRKDSASSRNSLLNSTIYTANDYISTMDMSQDRPWPISRDPSPSSRNEKP